MSFLRFPRPSSTLNPSSALLEFVALFLSFTSQTKLPTPSHSKCFDFSSTQILCIVTTALPRAFNIYTLLINFSIKDVAVSFRKNSVFQMYFRCIESLQKLTAYNEVMVNTLHGGEI